MPIWNPTGGGGGGGGGAVWGTITGALVDQTDLAGALSAKADASALAGTLSPSALNINSGATVTKILIGVANLGSGNVTAGSYLDVNVTVSGASVGDYACASLNTPTQQYIVISSCVVTSGVVTVRFVNFDTTDHSLNGEALFAIVFKAS